MKRSPKKLVKNSRPNKKLAVRQKQQFILPEQFLNSLEEFSGGGYVLIIANQDGDPQIYSQYDGGLQGAGLAKFGKEYFSKIDEKFSEMIDDHVEFGAAGEDFDEDGDVKF